MSAAYDDNLDLIIRIQPGGEEFEVELPAYTTGKEIIEELLDNDLAPRNNPENQPYVYELISKKKGKIADDKTLHELNIETSDMLYLSPRLNAGKINNI